MEENDISIPVAGEDRKIPPSVLHRLPRYLIYTQKIKAAKQEWISSRELAEALGLTSSTVRQDLSHLEFYGISKKGYEVSRLEEALLALFGVDRNIRMVVVGAGNIGRAISQYSGFTEYGMSVVHVLDNNPDIVGAQVGGIKVRAIDDLPEIVLKENIDVAILAVPFSAAQEVADKVMSAGIRGILNFTPAHIITNGKTRVIDNQIVASLLELNCLI